MTHLFYKKQISAEHLEHHTGMLVGKAGKGLAPQSTGPCELTECVMLFVNKNHALCHNHYPNGQ